MPGTPALVAEGRSKDDQSGHAKHSALLRSRIDTASRQQACRATLQLAILKTRRLDKRSNVGRNDEQEYLLVRDRMVALIIRSPIIDLKT